MWSKAFSELKVWQVALLLGAVALVAVVIGKFIVVDNMVTDNTHGSFVKKSLFMPLTAAKKAEIAAANDKAAAESAAKS